MNGRNRIIQEFIFLPIILCIFSGCAKVPNLPGKIVASYSGYEESGLLVYEHGRLQTLKEGGSTPRWVDAGKTIVYVQGKQQLSFVFTAFPDQKIVDKFAVPDLGTAFSFLPRASTVVYSNEISFEKGTSANLHLYDRAAKTDRQLTHYDEPRWFINSIDASPDGRWIVFAGGLFGKFSDVYRLELETGKAEKLFEGGRVDLAPDGKRIVFNAGGIRGEKFGTSDLVIYDFQTKQFTRLTNSKEMIFKHSPRFSPDGKWVAYIEEGAGPNNRSLVAIKTDGSGKKVTLIKPGYVLNSLDWGP